MFGARENFRKYNLPEFSEKRENKDCAQEKGHGSATDMARRKRVRQTSEREVGMLDMLLATTFGIGEEASHKDMY